MNTATNCKLQEIYHNGNLNNYPQVIYEYCFTGELIHTEIEYAEPKGKSRGVMYQIFKTDRDTFVLYREFFSTYDGEITFSVINEFNFAKDLFRRIPRYLENIVLDKLLRLKNEKLAQEEQDEEELNEDYVDSLEENTCPLSKEEYDVLWKKLMNEATETITDTNTDCIKILDKDNLLIIKGTLRVSSSLDEILEEFDDCIKHEDD